MEGTSNAKRSRNQRQKEADLQAEYLGPSYMDLPRDILVKILLKLSVMSIFVCKSVCKTWNDIISDHSFAELHFRQAEVCPLLRCSGSTLRSRMVYLVQPSEGNFERKLTMCDHEYPKLRCFCDVRLKLDTKLKLPIRNLDKILIDGTGEQLKMRNLESGGKLKSKDHKYGIVNTCNGLLCLSDPIMNDAIMVCNPLTGEFVNLPESEDLNGPIRLFNSITCGFGYSPTLDQYKVIRMSIHYIQGGNGIDPTMVRVTEVNVLGTNTWKNIGSHPRLMNKKFPTYFNGCIFWLAFECIVVFLIKEERFQMIPLPPLNNLNLIRCDSMGVLGNDIFITEQYDDIFCIWVKKDFFSRGAYWSKIFSTNLSTDAGLWPRGVYQPLKYLNNGAILMFHAPTNAFIYKDPRKHGYKYLKVRGVEAKLEAIPHIPSFISLKHILSGSGMEVLNIKSRCAGLKLHNETKAVSLVEEEFPDQ